jgi:hypothetical protein
LQVITLSGKWYLRKDIGLVFEIEYGNGRKRGMVFGADARLTDDDTVTFRLRNNAENKDIGAELEFSHRIFMGDGEAFLKVLASKRESTVYAGAAWGW